MRKYDNDCAVFRIIKCKKGKPLSLEESFWGHFEKIDFKKKLPSWLKNYKTQVILMPMCDICSLHCMLV